MFKMINSFSVDDIEGFAHDISNLELIGSYSIDESRQYLNDLSELKYYKNPSNYKNINIDLNAKCDKIDYPYENAKLNFLLEWISDNFNILKAKETNSEQWLEPEFICYRGVLKNILLTPLGYNDWIICALKFKGTIYLCYFDTPERKKETAKMSSWDKLNTAWGKEFERYMLSDVPSIEVDNVSTRSSKKGDFCCLFKLKFGNKSLLYGAEIDGICSQQIIEDTLVGKQIEFIELKTIPAKHFHKGKLTFKTKMLQLWAQSYWVQVKNIICGVKYNNNVKNITKLELKEFENHIKDEQTRCKRFCDQFLELIKMTVTENEDKCLYKFTFMPSKRRITVHGMKPDSQSEYTFLHSSYIDKANRHFKSS